MRKLAHFAVTSSTMAITESRWVGQELGPRACLSTPYEPSTYGHSFIASPSPCFRLSQSFFFQLIQQYDYIKSVYWAAKALKCQQLPYVKYVHNLYFSPSHPPVLSIPVTLQISFKLGSNDPRFQKNIFRIIKKVFTCIYYLS